MTDEQLPPSRRAAREARRAAEEAARAAAGGVGARVTGLQPPLADDGADGAQRWPVGRPFATRPVQVDPVQVDPVPDDLQAGPAPQPEPEQEPVVLTKPATVDEAPTTVPVAAPEPAQTPEPVAASEPVATSEPAEPVEPAGATTASRRARRSGGLAQAAAPQEFSLAQAVGGVRGAAETLVPGLLFVVVYTIGRDLRLSLLLAVGAAVLAILARVVTRSGPSQAISGAVGVAICAGFALVSGDARNFYLPGFLTNVGYGLVCALSTVSLPRFTVAGRVLQGPYPVIGLLLGPLTGEGLAWRRSPERLRAYRQVTLLWAGFFALRLLVQVPLYLADLVGALGAARLVMGVPAFALMVWLTWLRLRAVPPAVPDRAGAPPAG